MEPIKTPPEESLELEIPESSTNIWTSAPSSISVVHEPTQKREQVSRKRMLVTTGGPLLVTLLMLAVFSVWQFGKPSQQIKLSQDSVVNDVDVRALKLNDSLYKTISGSDRLVVNGSLVANNGLVLSNELLFNGVSYTSLSGTGLTVIDGVLQTTLGATVDLSSEVLGVTKIINGGTGATQAQTAINTLSGLSTAGDLLYHDGTNATRLARGSNGQCLLSSGTTVGWSSCADPGTTLFNLAGSSGIAQSINGGDTVTISAGTNVTSVAGSTNTVTLSVVNNPTFSGLVTANGGLTVEVGDTFIFNGDAFTDLTGTGLQISSGSLQTTLGVSVDLTTEISGTLGMGDGGTGANSTQGAINALSQLTTNGDLLYNDGTNSTRLSRGTNGQCLTSNATTILWGTCAGSGTTYFTLAGTSGSGQSINGGDTVTIAAGTNITTTGGATDTVTVTTVDNPIFGTSVTSPIYTSTAGLAVTGGTIVTISSTGAGNDVVINGADILDVQDNATFAGTLDVTNTVTLTGDLVVNGNTTIGNAVTDNLTVTAAIQGTNALIFDGLTNDTNEITLTVTDPGGDFTITLPAANGTVCLTSGNCAGVGGVGDILNNGQNGQVRIGSNDANSTILESNGVDRLTIDSSGAVTFAGALSGITTIATSSTINSQTISSSANFTGTLAVQGASVTVGTASTTNGTIKLLNSTNAFGVTISASAQTAGDATVSFPNTAGVADTFCLLTLNNCSSGSGANTALSNLASVAINTSLLPVSDDAIDLGDNTHRFRDLYLGGETLHIGTSTSDEGAISYTTSTNILTLQSTGTIALNDSTSITGTLGVGVAADASYILYAYYDSNTYARLLNDDNGDFYISGANADLYVVDDSNAAYFTRIHHNGSSGYIDTGTGSLVLRPADGNVNAGSSTIWGGAILASNIFHYANSTQIGSSSACRSSLSAYAGGYYTLGHCSSLARYKDEVQDLPYDLDTIRQLRPVKYKWNIDDNSYDIGFIAEEVNAVNPIFNEYSNGVLSGVKYDHMVALAIKGVQELDIQAQDIDTRLAVLESGEFAGDIHVAANAEIDGTLTVVGNAELMGSLKVLGNTEVANLKVNGKIITAGATPTVVLGATTTGNGSTYSIEGNDTAGTITIITGTSTPASPLSAGEQAALTFAVPFVTTPRITLTPNTEDAANINFYVAKSEIEFKIHFTSAPEENKTYSFDYQILQ